MSLTWFSTITFWLIAQNPLVYVLIEEQRAADRGEG